MTPWHPAQFRCRPAVAHECCVHIFSTTLLVEQGWSQLMSLCHPAIAPCRPFYMKRGQKYKQGATVCGLAPRKGWAVRLWRTGCDKIVSEPTLMVARTGQCAGIWCMAGTFVDTWCRHWTYVHRVGPTRSSRGCMCHPVQFGCSPVVAHECCVNMFSSSPWGLCSFGGRGLIDFHPRKINPNFWSVPKFA